jgi:hypothetical protein
VENRCAVEESAMSREALSLEISQVVSRIIGGEPVDTAERGTLLARKYPELGMSGEMIGNAIVSAADMMDMIRRASMPRAQSAPSAGHANGTNGASGKLTLALLPAVARSIEDDLASAIDAEFGGLRTKRVPPRSPNRRGTAAAARNSLARSRRRGAIAALRRALFRH